ncbi:MAG TPA: histidine phosphatase family protein [Thermoanaerobaculia bacterium]|nr:histidine phosphatase family protein [Thermoanaerobaculia bacterium]
MTTTLLLLRHAHTEANEHGSSPRMAGWCDIAVSAQGEAQLAALRRVALGALAPLVYSSTSPRALRTAAAAARGRRVVPLRSLREISCGDVEGWLIKDVMRSHPELWERNMAQDDPDFGWPGGESYARFRARVLRALRGIAARHRGERVLVATHAGAIAQVAGHIDGVTAARWELHRPANCSVTTVECDRDGTMRLIEFDRRIVPALTSAADVRRRAG